MMLACVCMGIGEAAVGLFFCLCAVLGYRRKRG